MDEKENGGGNIKNKIPRKICLNVVQDRGVRPTPIRVKHFQTLLVAASKVDCSKRN